MNRGDDVEAFERMWRRGGCRLVTILIFFGIVIVAAWIMGRILQ